eukprot:6883988-Prymnesium_polylepis.1
MRLAPWVPKCDIVTASFRRESQKRTCRTVPLTAFYFFTDSKSAEARAQGVRAPQRVSTLMRRQKRAPPSYLEECKQRAIAAGDDAEDEGEGEGEGDEEIEEKEDAETNGELTPMMPLSLLRKVLQHNPELPKVWARESPFTIAKSTEFFLERCVWDAARQTGREG